MECIKENNVVFLDTNSTILTDINDYTKSPRIFGAMVTLGAVVTLQIINTCGVWGIRAGVQVSMREFHIHIHFRIKRNKELKFID